MSILKETDIILLEKLKEIKNTFIELDDLSHELFIDLKKNFVIDDKMIFEEEFDSLNNSFNEIKNELINEAIPSVNNRL